MALRSMSLMSFKTTVGCQKLDIFKNPKTDKLFAAGDNGKTYKVQQAIDFKKPIVVLFDDEDSIDESACIINEGSGGLTAIKSL